MKITTPYVVCWLRRDLRLNDNAALYHALRSGYPVLPIFIFDQNILDKLPEKDDARVSFIHQEISRLKSELELLGSTLKVYFGKPLEIFRALSNDSQLQGVYTNNDYEPYAQERDQEISKELFSTQKSFHSHKDIVVFEKDEVTKDDGKPYTVFTPYSKKWLTKLNAFYLKSYPCESYAEHYLKTAPAENISLADIGFEASTIAFPDRIPDLNVINVYDQNRDFPWKKGTSRLSLHLRFGTVSIRKLATIAQQHNATWLNELIWRDFYQMIMWHFPNTVSKAFKPQYDRIQWRNNEAEFAAWREGNTGYPIVDAGMRELNTTGFMHNRVRMIVASFLTKHLLIDWRWGEAYFAQKLLDFELASNVGGWQWAASSGCDAAPYFRVFNPSLQTEKFDKSLLYVRKWVPEFQELTYTRPIVDHKFARERVLATYKAALGSNA